MTARIQVKRVARISARTMSEKCLGRKKQIKDNSQAAWGAVNGGHAGPRRV